MHSIKEKTWRQLFELGIGLKGFKALSEIILGLTILLVDVRTLNHLFSRVVNSQIFEGFNYKIIILLNKYITHFSSGTKIFTSWYIIAQGVISLFIVVSLHLNKLWAYIVMMLATIAFMLYQFYGIFFRHLYPLGILTIFDVAFLILTWHEYKYQKSIRYA